MRLVYIFLFISSTALGQLAIVNSPHVVSNAGDTWSTNNYNISFTLGEIAIETLIQSNIILTQGFHQEENVSTVDIIDENIDYHTIIFPNPTQNNLFLNFGNKSDHANIFVKNVMGSLVYSSYNHPTNEIKNIDLSFFSSGFYFIEISLNKHKKNEVYQIQKIN